MNGLQITDTNSREDSQGEVFGLSGNLIYIALGGLIASLLIFVVLHEGLSKSLFISFIFSAPVLGGVLGYIFCLKQGKPKGYDQDFFENLIFGSNWTLNFFNQPKILKSDDI